MQNRTWSHPLCAFASLVLIGCGAAQEDGAPMVSSAPMIEQAVRAEADCPVCAIDSSMATAWMETVMGLVKTERVLPPVASRIYGYAGLTLYEALLPGMRPRYRSLGGQLNGLARLPKPRLPARNYDWESVANAALAVTTSHLFGNQATAAQTTITTLVEAQFKQRRAAGVSVQKLLRSAWFGWEIASAIVAYADADGFAQTRGRTFTPPVGDGYWLPTGTAPSTQLPAEPYWGTLRPFALSRADECAPNAPIPFSSDQSSAFYEQANTVYETAASLTEEQRTIAIYWADNAGQTATPPGHWMGIVSDLVRDDTLAVAAEAFALVGVTTADAFISVWNTKYQYNLLRPETYIRRYIDPSWMPLLPTPQFPEYTSGHSGVSGASATVLTDLFGVVPFTEITPVAAGMAPRSFASFQAAAAEAATSRLYGGIHFPMGNESGLAQGKCVGEKVIAITNTRAQP